MLDILSKNSKKFKRQFNIGMVELKKNNFPQFKSISEKCVECLEEINSSLKSNESVQSYRNLISEEVAKTISLLQLVNIMDQNELASFNSIKEKIIFINCVTLEEQL